MISQRVCYTKVPLENTYGRVGIELKETPINQANLISSLTRSGNHAPVFDIDGVAIRLLPTSTPGNSHLFIEQEMSWEDLVELLNLLVRLKIIDEKWAQASIEAKMCLVRKPGVLKPNAPDEAKVAHRMAVLEMEAAELREQLAETQRCLEQALVEGWH